eukprot:scaffold5864_cov74-Cyclotella_meneghiniana.AAC.3
MRKIPSRNARQDTLFFRLCSALFGPVLPVPPCCALVWPFCPFRRGPHPLGYDSWVGIMDKRSREPDTTEHDLTQPDNLTEHRTGHLLAIAISHES